MSVVGWLDRKVYEETGDEERAQGWTPFILDTNSTRTPFHNEGGKANRPNVVRFQMRPDPLAR